MKCRRLTKEQRHAAYRTPRTYFTWFPVQSLNWHWVRAYSGILRKQARDAEIHAKEPIALDGVTYMDWLDEAAIHIMEIWPDHTYEKALLGIRDYMKRSGTHFPDPGYDWSYNAARDMADEFMLDTGEQNTNH